MNNISNFSTFLVLFLQRYVFVSFTPFSLLLSGVLHSDQIYYHMLFCLFHHTVDWSASFFLVKCFRYLYWFLDWNWTSISHVTFAGYVRRDSSWFTICYILFEQIETEVRPKVSFWPALWSSFIFKFRLFDAQIPSFHALFTCFQLMCADVWVSQVWRSRIHVMTLWWWIFCIFGNELVLRTSYSSMFPWF